MVRLALTLCSFFFASPAKAGRVVMEQIPVPSSTGFLMTVDTQNAHLTLGATWYPGTIATVGLYSSSNVVIGNCVVYATGTAYCPVFDSPALKALGISTNTFNVWMGTTSIDVAALSISSRNLASGSATTYVTVNGDTMTGTLTITGANAYAIFNSSVTGGLFTGDGAGLYGLNSGTVTVAASLYGKGVGGDLLGVLSSSVAVLNSSGFALNQQIDPSSVAKYSGGLIVNATIDVSSIAKYNASGFIVNNKIDGSSVAKLGSTGFIVNGQIDPSSVTKYNSSGFVVNNTIDPSSVTKQGWVALNNLGGGVPGAKVDFATITLALQSKLSSGPVPSNFIDLSTVATRFNMVATDTTTLFDVRASSGVNNDIDELKDLDVGGLKDATVNAADLATGLGITSTCAAGFYLSTITVVNGIVTGGGCVADASGGGGGSSTMTIGYVFDNFLGQLNGSATAFTLSAVPSSTAAILVVLDGLLQSPTSDYTYSSLSNQVGFTTAPAANSSSFFVQYLVNTSTFGAVGAPTTFLSSMTVSAAVYTTTSTLSAVRTVVSGASVGQWMVVASTNPSVAGTIEFTGLVPGRLYRLNFSMYGSAANALYYRFNRDAGANYDTEFQQIVQTVGQLTEQFDGDTECQVQGSYTQSAANLWYHGTINFRTEPGDDTDVIAFHTMGYRQNATIQAAGYGSCDYVGASNLTSVALIASAGGYTGYVYLEQLVFPLP